MSPPTPADTARIQQKYHLKNPYFFTLGTLEPRKNFHMAIAAFSAAHIPHTELIIAGGENNNIFSTPHLPRAEHVRMLGIIPEQDKAALMAGSLAVIVPSIYEGYSLPVAEALAVAAPVLVSDIAAHREVAGSSALYAPPADTQAWIHLIRAAAHHHTPQKGEHTRTWHDVGQDTVQALQKACHA